MTGSAESAALPKLSLAAEPPSGSMMPKQVGSCSRYVPSAKQASQRDEYRSGNPLLENNMKIMRFPC